MPQGFSLLEILVALILMAFSMLALIKGLLSAQHHAIESVAFAQADTQAQNIYEAMHANTIAVRQGSYYQRVAYPPSARVASCHSCDPAQQAAYDLAQWQEQLVTQLVLGKGEITAYGYGQRIMIHWQTLENININEWLLYGSIE